MNNLDGSSIRFDSRSTIKTAQGFKQNFIHITQISKGDIKLACRAGNGYSTGIANTMQLI